MVAIKPKRSESAAPTSGSIDVHELAMDLNAGRLYSKKSDGSVVQFYNDLANRRVGAQNLISRAAWGVHANASVSWGSSGWGIRLTGTGNLETVQATISGLRRDTLYSVRFRAKLTSGTSQDINIDLNPDTLPEIQRTITNADQVFVWEGISSSSADIEGAVLLRFFRSPLPIGVTVEITDIVFVEASVAPNGWLPAPADSAAELASAVSTINSSVATKAPLASPSLTGTPTAPTAALGTNTTQIATTAFAEARVRALGLGGTTQSLGVADMNAAAMGSFASYNGTAAEGAANNWPTIASGSDPMWWNVLTTGVGNRTTQIAFFGYSFAADRIFTRARHDSTWTPWFEFLTSNKGVKKENFTYAVDGVDLNTIIESGFFRLQGSPTNGPAGAGVGYGQFVVSRHGDTIAQTVYPYESSEMYVRTGSAIGTATPNFNAWRKVGFIDQVVEIDAKKFGMTCDGAASDNAGLAAAFMAQDEVVVRPGQTLTISADYTVARGKRLALMAGAKIKVKTGATLTVNGLFDAPDHGSIIIMEGTGKLVGVPNVYIPWFLQVPTAHLNDAFDAALACVDASVDSGGSFVSDGGEVTLRFPSGKFYAARAFYAAPTKAFSFKYVFGDGTLESSRCEVLSTFAAGSRYSLVTYRGINVRPVFHIGGTPQDGTTELAKFTFGPGLKVYPSAAGKGDATWAYMLGSFGTGTNSLGATAPNMLKAERNNDVYLASEGLHHCLTVNASRIRFMEQFCKTGASVAEARGLVFTVDTGGYCGDHLIMGGMNLEGPKPGDAGYANSRAVECFAASGNFSNATGAGANFLTWIQSSGPVAVHGFHTGVRLEADYGSQVNEVKLQLTHDQGNTHYLHVVSNGRVGYALPAVRNYTFSPEFMTGATDELVLIESIGTGGIIDNGRINPTKVYGLANKTYKGYGASFTNFHWDGARFMNLSFVSGSEPVIDIAGGTSISFTNLDFSVGDGSDPYVGGYIRVSRDADYVNVDGVNFRDASGSYYIRDLSREQIDGTPLSGASSPAYQERKNRYSAINITGRAKVPVYSAAGTLAIEIWDHNQIVKVTGDADIAQILGAQSGDWLELYMTGNGTFVDGSSEGGASSSTISLPSGNKTYKPGSTFKFLAMDGVWHLVSFSIN